MTQQYFFLYNAKSAFAILFLGYASFGKNDNINRIQHFVKFQFKIWSASYLKFDNNFLLKAITYSLLQQIPIGGKF